MKRVAFAIDNLTKPYFLKGKIFAFSDGSATLEIYALGKLVHFETYTTLNSAKQAWDRFE